MRSTELAPAVAVPGKNNVAGSCLPERHADAGSHTHARMQGSVLYQAADSHG